MFQVVFHFWNFCCGSARSSLAKKLEKFQGIRERIVKPVFFVLILGKVDISLDERLHSRIATKQKSRHRGKILIV